MTKYCTFVRVGKCIPILMNIILIEKSSILGIKILWFAYKRSWTLRLRNIASSKRPILSNKCKLHRIFPRSFSPPKCNHLSREMNFHHPPRGAFRLCKFHYIVRRCEISGGASILQSTPQVMKYFCTKDTGLDGRFALSFFHRNSAMVSDRDFHRCIIICRPQNKQAECYYCKFKLCAIRFDDNALINIRSTHQRKYNLTCHRHGSLGYYYPFVADYCSSVRLNSIANCVIFVFRLSKCGKWIDC